MKTGTKIVEETDTRSPFQQNFTDKEHCFLAISLYFVNNFLMVRPICGNRQQVAEESDYQNRQQAADHL